MTLGTASRYRVPIIVAIAAALSLILIAALVWRSWAPLPSAPSVRSRAQALAARPLRDIPKVAPNEIIALPERDAQQINATRAFSTAPNLPAAPFRSSLQDVALERATDCLAAAGWYEAGLDATGQEAVMQVILNRVRHPAFPASVCGTVFQGSERTTGCQFTFTCDGSMRRRAPSPAAWVAARGRAAAALARRVFAPVGTATHYHTDWVVPYWSISLDKIVNIDTHLFFRWRGFWGTRAAFRQRPGAEEPVIAAMAGLSAAHRPSDATVVPPVMVSTGDPAAAAVGAPSVPPAAGQIQQLALPADSPSGRFALLALDRCKGQPSCVVAGWADPASVPGTLDAAALTATPPDFLFVQLLRNRVQKAYWNCTRFPRDRSECLSGNAADLVLNPR